MASRDGGFGWESLSVQRLAVLLPCIIDGSGLLMVLIIHFPRVLSEYLLIYESRSWRFGSDYAGLNDCNYLKLCIEKLSERKTERELD